MDNLEKKLEALKKEDGKGSRLQVPNTFLKEISRFQEAWKLSGKGRVSREDVIWRMMLHGAEGLNGERKELLKLQIEKRKELLKLQIEKMKENL